MNFKKWYETCLGPSVVHGGMYQHSGDWRNDNLPVRSKYVANDGASLPGEKSKDKDGNVLDVDSQWLGKKRNRHQEPQPLDNIRDSQPKKTQRQKVIS